MSYWDPIDLADDRLAAGFAGMALRRAKVLEGGARHVGWKVGINDVGFRARLGIASGVVGFLTDRTQSAGDVDVSGATTIGIEIEVAVVLGDDLQIAALRPAIEIVDIVGGDIGSALGRDVWHHAFVLGRPTPWRTGLIDELRVVATHDGEPLDVPPPGDDKLADVEGLLRFTADGVAAFGDQLRAGDVILGGNLVSSMQFGSAGSTVTATIEPLGTVEARLIGDQAP